MDARREPQGKHAMSFAEIAAEMGCSVSTVYSLYTRALRKLERRTPNTMRLLRTLAADLAAERQERQCAH